MVYNTLDNISDLSLINVLNFPNLDTPEFYPIFLLVIFSVFSSLSFFREVTREGKGNLLSSLAVGGYVCIASAGILSLMGLIQTAVLVTAIVASLVFIVLFILTKR